VIATASTPGFEMLGRQFVEGVLDGNVKRARVAWSNGAKAILEPMPQEFDGIELR
jgi:hypothetical protein